MSSATNYDAIIVGAGIAGALIAKQLGLAGKKVLILEAGEGVPGNNVAYMQRFYMSDAKVPEAPYTPDLINPVSQQLQDPTQLNAGRPTVLTLDKDSWQDPTKAYLIQSGPLPFSSTYERIAGGTTRHWLGTSLRNVPNDFTMQTTYGQMLDWPIGYDDLSHWYDLAEFEIGISAEVAEQSYLGIQFSAGYRYPMNPIPLSLVDQAVQKGVQGMEIDGIALNVRSTPVARNSQPYQNRRVCAGNTNCIPICPIQAKYDATITLNAALDTGNVSIWAKTVVSELISADDGTIAEVRYLTYDSATGPQTGSGSVQGTVVILAAHGIETPRLLLMSKNGGKTPNGIANTSDQVGRNLMDHPLYLAWATTPQPIWGFRGPLSTSGIEDMRDGAFRSERASFRIEIGNEGWNFSSGDPNTTTFDMINGWNAAGLNTGGPGGMPQVLSGTALTKALNQALSRQFRLGFLVEQTPDPENRVTLSATERDNLGLPRPQISYNLSDYTKKGFVAAKEAADQIFAGMGATQFTTTPAEDDPTSFMVEVKGVPTRMKFFGAGHVVGTYRMGNDSDTSVVDPYCRSWTHRNLFLVGSGVFPTVATANPTLTIAALALRTADTILQTNLA